MRLSKLLIFVFLLISALSVQAQKKAYICSSESIYLADLDNCSAQLLSSTPMAIWTDMALHPITDTLYLIDYQNLYWVDKNNGTPHLIGSTQQSFNALTFGKDGTLYAMSVFSNYLYTINTQTGAPTSLGSTMLPANSAGDLAFYNDTLYMLGYYSSQYRILGKIDLDNINNSSVVGYFTDEYTYGLATLGCDKHLYGFFHRDVYKFESLYPLNKQLFCQTIVPESINGVASINEDIDIVEIDLGLDRVLCAGEIHRINLPNPNILYTWSNGSTGASLDINSAGTYWVEAKNDSCIARDTIEVDYQTCDCVRIPNAFTPNDDRHNDFFKPIVDCPLRDIRFRIFNRWGQTVYDQEDVSIGWDGYFQGVACSQDVYIYLFEYKLWNGAEKAIKGQVTLIN